jgi:membrane protein YdbS with pleckstrin-like domain
VTLPRRYLNDDEDLLVQLRPHWIFFAGPLLVTVLAVAVVITIIVGEPSAPSWLADGLWILAAIPGVWLLLRLARWRLYTFALTTTRILVRRNVFDRNIVQIRLQRITGLSLSQTLLERALATGRLVIDVQGGDDEVVLPFIRKPTILQRVINGQINELVGGGNAEPIPAELRSIDLRSSRSRVDVADDGPETPPFGVAPVTVDDTADIPVEVMPPTPTPTPTPTASVPVAAPRPPPAYGSGPAEIRDRLIELDDLRQRGIISQEEFAAKKAELLSRI